MKRDFTGDFSNTNPHELFILAIKARARGDVKMLIRLKHACGENARQYLTRITASKEIAAAMLIELTKVEAYLSMFNELVLPLADYATNLVDVSHAKGHSTSGQEEMADKSKERFLEDVTEDFQRMIAEKTGPSWLAIDSFCQSDIGLEPDLLLQAWFPNSISLLKLLMPMLDTLDPDRDIDLELESELCDFWRTYTS